MKNILFAAYVLAMCANAEAAVIIGNSVTGPYQVGTNSGTKAVGFLTGSNGLLLDDIQVALGGHDSAGGTSSSVTKFITLAPLNHYGYYRVSFEEPIHHLGSQPKLGATPDTVTIQVPGLPTAGTAQCASWAGDGSHRIPMMERANQTPAFDAVRIRVR